MLKNLFKQKKNHEDEEGLIWTSVDLSTDEKKIKIHHSSYEEMCEKNNLDAKTTRNFVGQKVKNIHNKLYYIDLV